MHLCDLFHGLLLLKELSELELGFSKEHHSLTLVLSDTALSKPASSLAHALYLFVVDASVNLVIVVRLKRLNHCRMLSFLQDICLVLYVAHCVSATFLLESTQLHLHKLLQGAVDSTVLVMR